MYRYHIEGYDAQEDEHYNEHGIIAADSYGAAVTEITKYYGEYLSADNYIDSIEIYELDEILSEDELKEMIGDNWCK